MNALIIELTRLAESENADFRLDIGKGYVQARWKGAGRRAEVVTQWHLDARYPGAEVAGVLRELVKRLGFAGLPTTDNVLDKATPRQRERVYELVREVNQIRREICEGIAPSVEPRLAAPRSCLNPSNFMIGPEEAMPTPKTYVPGEDR